MSSGPNDDDIQQLIMMILGRIEEHDIQLEGAGVLMGAMATLIKTMLPTCNAHECNRLAMHRCGGSHKRGLCDYHLAEHLAPFKDQKSVFDYNRQHWKEVEHARALETLENFLEDFSEHSSMSTLH